MKPGHESQTAVVVCMARAIAHESVPGIAFSDPTALALLPPEARARVDRMRERAARGAVPTFREAIARRRATMMVARTMEIDAALRAHPAKQVVILGAGLDGRAWRMPELSDSVVFEVDHPDSQQAKRARVAALPQVAREVRFVPVDFTRDDLEEKLAAAGHDAQQPTTWIWEGVVMYLSPEEVEASVAAIARRSAPGSVLVILYHCSTLLSLILGQWLKRLGEPLRSSFKRHEMQALLARQGFRVLGDEDLPSIAQKRSPSLARETRPMKHLRIVTAERA